jgi:hypothetical protein
MSDRTALNFTNVYEMSKSENFSGLDQVDLPISALYKLAAPSTHEATRIEIFDRAKAGERFSVTAVEEAIADARTDEWALGTECGSDRAALFERQEIDNSSGAFEDPWPEAEEAPYFFENITLWECKDLGDTAVPAFDARHIDKAISALKDLEQGRAALDDYIRRLKDAITLASTSSNFDQASALDQSAA